LNPPTESPRHKNDERAGGTAVLFEKSSAKTMLHPLRVKNYSAKGVSSSLKKCI
jgi:hypothetical protein